MTGTAFFTLLAQTKSLGPLFLMTGTALFTPSTFSSSAVIFWSSLGRPGSATGAQIDPRGSPWLRRGPQTDPPGMPRDARGTKLSNQTPCVQSDPLFFRIGTAVFTLSAFSRNLQRISNEFPRDFQGISKEFPMNF